jgi:hypothetical protein
MTDYKKFRALGQGQWRITAPSTPKKYAKGTVAANTVTPSTAEAVGKSAEVLESGQRPRSQHRY